MTTTSILTTAEAMTYVKVGSIASFRRWCKAYNCHTRERGRWAKINLDRAIEREAMGRRAS